ncbi:juvenile hormone epoxide hydrolase [Amyelois transitella]|uniref:juvenile hormone epoxide hydrolase n=1 Tax=Amyelois transitella TaxID=680683 RepID=UPI00067E0545|nr:juvenile hormone epoxide hydrolase [Amyelois transitella]
MIYKLLSLIVGVAAIMSGVFLLYLTQRTQEKPSTINRNKWWGIGSKPRQQDTFVKEFNIDFSDTLVNDLKQRLRNRRPFTKPLSGIQSEYGMNTKYLEKIITYWLERYDFKQRAEMLNSFSHYKTRIQGLDLHFIWEKPVVKDPRIKVLPLLMLHGWPSSSKEFVKVIPYLTTQREGYDFVFEVVAADLPGFGYSEGTKKPGLNPVQIGIMMRNLMKRLGFEKFYVQAGDWGSQCATHMATLYPDEVLGFHTNMPISSRRITLAKILIGSIFPGLVVEAKYKDRIYPLGKLLKYIIREGGYFLIQATKPDTIGVALTDSPAGLAAYIIEKMGMCCNRDQINTPHSGIENLNIDDVLDTITITWMNNCIVTSSRIYYEAMNSDEVYIVHEMQTQVPTAVVNYKYEVLYQSDSMLRDKFINLVRSTTHDIGGHFAALHTPQLFVEDLFASGRAFLNFHAQRAQQKRRFLF